MKLPKWMIMLGLSFAMGYLFAITLDVEYWLTLPRNDFFFGTKPFADAVEIRAVSFIAFLLGLVVFPFFYWELRRRPLVRSSLIVASIVEAEIFLVTPINPIASFLLSYVAFAVGICAAWVLTSPREPVR